MRGRKWLTLLTNDEIGRYTKGAKSSGSTTGVFVAIIIIIIFYHVYAGHLQVQYLKQTAFLGQGW
jgi:hypothetical protein